MSEQEETFPPWLWPIQRPYSLVLDQEYLKLFRQVCNIHTYLISPTQPKYRRRPIYYGTIFSRQVHSHTIEEAEPMTIIPPNTHPLQNIQWEWHLIWQNILWWPPRLILSSHPIMACSRINGTKIMAIVVQVPPKIIPEW